MNRILLLDADGVISPHRPPGEDSGLEYTLVFRLWRVIRDTGCKIILSSAWRYRGWGPDSLLGQCLVGVERGHTAIAVDILEAIVGALFLEVTPIERDELIRKWVDENQPSGPWVAVDDLECIERLGEGHYVRTDGSVGLTQRDAERLTRLLLKGAT